MTLSTGLNILVGFVQPIPYINRFEFTVPNGLSYENCTYNVDVLLITAMLLFRLPTLFRFVQSRSDFWESRSIFQPNFQLADPNDYYLFYRYCHHLYPIQLHLTTCVVYTALVGYAYYIIERGAVDW